VSILVKAALGLVAGVVAGGLGLAFVPRVAPNALQPRHAVEKPQFVVASASREAPRAAVSVAAVAAPEPAKPPGAPANPLAAPANPVAAPAQPVALASPIKTVELSPPKPSPSATTVAVVSAGPAPQVSAPANEVAARWSVQGLVALAKGDLASARQFLTRAAEAGDPRAWVALADTYDPAMLSKLGVVGAPGDAQRARDYLVKAAAAGVVVAKDRMVAADQNAGAVR
jgi:TPR repeat protein